MGLNLVKIGNPLLRVKARPVPKARIRGKAFHAFLKKMASAMRRWKGVGLAANQAGKGTRVFVMECRGSGRYPQAPAFPLQAYVNPRIVGYSRKKSADWEGCLSVPGYRGLVPRSERVVLEAVTPQGRKIRRIFRGFEARVVQHEVDHLNGLIYMDRMPGLRNWTHLEEFNRKFKAKVKDRK